MKIALTSPGIFPYVLGGIQRHSFNLARHLARLGIEIDLYHTNFQSSEGIDSLDGMTDSEKQQINSIAIPWPTGDCLPGHYVRNLKRFSEQIYGLSQQRSPADFVYGQSLTAWSFMKQKLAGQPLPPVGVNLHGYEMFQTSASTRNFIENKLLQPSFQHHAHHADYVFSLGGKLTDLIQTRTQVSRERIIEINVGIDSSWIAPNVHPVSTPRRFVFLGRYERRKGIEELQSVIQANPDWQNCAEFRFIGPIPASKQLQMPHVSYAGKIMDESRLQKELHCSDILLCPSHSEGMPTVILEAMASGLAVIATDVGAVRLMVGAENGQLLPKVTTSGLATAIESFITVDADKLLSMKQSSLQQVSAFKWDAIASKTVASIQSILDKPQ